MDTNVSDSHSNPPQPGTLAELYTFDWSAFHLRSPIVCSFAILICLVVGILAGHPGGGLIAAGGAMTLGFGVNQRIGVSRLWPMTLATITMFLSTLVGMRIGYHNVVLAFACALWAFTYGILTARAEGWAWAGQQACIYLFVASAFPAHWHDAIQRASLVLVGGAIQIAIVGLLHNRFIDLVRHPFTPDHRRELRRFFDPRRLRFAHRVLQKESGFGYGLELAITIAISAEIYRRLNIRSGYWIPMTALLVQKPRFLETLNRVLLRVGGTLAGAILSTFFILHVHPHPMWLAVLATLFALLAYSTLLVNYGLYAVCLTAYIVFLLSLDTLPSQIIAERRSLCTIAGGLFALVIHVTELYRHKLPFLPQRPSQVDKIEESEARRHPRQSSDSGE